MEKKKPNSKASCVFVDAHGLFSDSTTSGLALHCTTFLHHKRNSYNPVVSTSLTL